MNAYEKIRKTISCCVPMSTAKKEALATLAELERAAQTPAPVAEIREPTPEECERICTEYERLLMREGTCGGRDAFDAVRAVMWPKSEGS